MILKPINCIKMQTNHGHQIYLSSLLYVVQCKQKERRKTRAGCSSLNGMIIKFTTQVSFFLSTGCNPKTQLRYANTACSIICHTSVSAVLSQTHFELWFELVVGQRWHKIYEHQKQKEQQQKWSILLSWPTSWAWMESKPPFPRTFACKFPYAMQQTRNTISQAKLIEQSGSKWNSMQI